MVDIRISFLIALQTFFTATRAQTLVCLVLSSTGVPMDRQPVYLQGTQLAYPKYIKSNSYLSVNASSTLTLSCTGTGNTIVGASQTEITPCVGDTTFLLRAVATDLGKIQCNSTVKSELSQTQRKCGPAGSLVIEVGFKVGTKFYKLFETCHNNSAQTTAFALHKLSHLVVIGSQKNPDRPSFKKGLDTVYKGVNPDELYKKVNQEQMMINYLKTNKYYDSTRNYFSKGHLAPDADFILSNWQFATYYYVDTAPQWFGLNSGNWLAVERTLRNLADHMRDDLEVATGTYGILELKDASGVVKPMYMDPNVKAIPVPRVFWKSVYHRSSGAGMVLLMENNPFERGVPLCTDVCSENNWSFTNSLERGFVYCCPQAQLKSRIPYLPFTNATSVLKYK